MNIEEIRHLGAIDIHSHLGYAHEPESDPLRDGSVQCLLKNMEASQIRLSVNSSWYALSPQGSGYTVEGNRQCLEEAENNADIYMWVTIDPYQPESFAQAQDYLKHEKVLGIKIHPQLHDYDLLKEGDKLFSFAAKQGVPILGHSGIEHMLPMEYCILADRYPEIPVIAAHLGCGGDHLLQMRALEQNWSGNLLIT